MIFCACDKREDIIYSVRVFSSFFFYFHLPKLCFWVISEKIAYHENIFIIKHIFILVVETANFEKKINSLC